MAKLTKAAIRPHVAKHEQGGRVGIALHHQPVSQPDPPPSIIACPTIHSSTARPHQDRPALSPFFPKPKRPRHKTSTPPSHQPLHPRSSSSCDDCLCNAVFIKHRSRIIATLLPTRSDESRRAGSSVVVGSSYLAIALQETKAHHHAGSGPLYYKSFIYFLHGLLLSLETHGTPWRDGFHVA